MALKTPRLDIEELAALCLEYLAQNPEQLAEFMVQTGIQPTALRRLIGTHEFAHGLLDYVVAKEPLLLAIAGANQLKPEIITRTWAMHDHTEH